MISASHSGNIGDVVACLPTLKALAGEQQAAIYLKTGAPARYGTGMVHPLGTELLNQEWAEKLLPLLRAQPYIGHAALWEGQEVDYDLDRFRQVPFDLSRGSIYRYAAWVFPCLPRVWEPWLQAEPSPDTTGLVLVNRTCRYRNPAINYSFLKGRADVAFLGLPAEYQSVRAELGSVPVLTARDHLELARWIAGAKCVLANQSFVYAVAEGLKVPRLLEMCPFCANACPCGDKGYEAIDQNTFEILALRLMNV